MNKSLWLIGFVGMALLVLSAGPTQADFVQCDGSINCNGTDNADVINGAPGDETIHGMMGDDMIFGGPGMDGIHGDEGNDFLSGGLGSDIVEGEDGNDILSAGPDQIDFLQEVNGENGNDIANVLVGETSSCLFIRGGAGNDTVNLVGFGPYSAEPPFGQPGFTGGFAYLVDPVAGGEIFIEVIEGGDAGTEMINGLPSPNLTILPYGSEQETACPQPPPVNPC